MTRSVFKDRRERKPGDPTVQKRFAAEKFSWLERVAADRELPPFASRLAITLSRMFNVDRTGAAWPRHEELAEKLGVDRRTIVRTLAVMIKRKHLTTKKRGWSRPNSYRMESPEKGESGDNSVTALKSRAVTFDATQGDKIVSIRKKSPSNTPEHPKQGVPAERVGAAGDPQQAKRGRKTKAKRAAKPRRKNRPQGDGQNPSALTVPDVFDELAKIWDRPEHRATDARQRAAARKLFAAATSTLPPATLMVAAEAWLAAYPGARRRYLPSLRDWLADRKWEQQPPQPSARSSAKSGKPNMAIVGLRLGTRFDDAGNLVNKDTGAIVVPAKVLQ